MAWLGSIVLSVPMADYDFILLGVALVLLLCLYWCSWRRNRREESSHVIRPGHGIDVSGISERLHRVRGDYGSEAESRWRGTHRRPGLLTLARQAVRCLSFFRHRSLGSGADRQVDSNPPFQRG
jgi:hypothetical protein